ncbi:MAG: ATP-binding protein, partial [Chitinophagaceae bacterium]
SEVENIQELNKDEILDKLDAIYEISRDISYDRLTPPHEDFSIKLASMFNSYKSDHRSIQCEGNHTSLWQDVNEVSKEEVFLVLQELLTNTDKHSGASEVTIRIWQEDEQINIHYRDNGIGLADGQNFNNGLTNTVSRINAIAGTITFEAKNKKGLEVQISFPTF